MIISPNFRIFSAISPQLQLKLEKAIKQIKDYSKNELKNSHSPIKNILLIYFAILLIIFSYTAYNLYRTYKKVEQERKNEIERMLYWEEMLAQHPTFPDAYYQAAFHAVRLGYDERANRHLAKAISLDPTFNAAKLLQKYIQEKKY